MGTTLTGTTPQDTYDSLIKVTDNGPLGPTTAKYLSDGLGNDSVLALSQAAVGIGTTNPLNPLFVSASNAGDYAAFIENTNSSNGYGLVARTAHTGASGYAFAARAGATDIFVVRADGHVGIGTGAPASTLDVSGTFGVTGVSTFSSAITAATGSNFTGTAVNSKVLVTAAGVANTVLGFNNSGSAESGVVNNAGYVAILQDYPFVVAIADAEKMRITSAGTVGIGTSAPEALLDLYSASGVQLRLANATTGTDATDGTRIYLSGSDLFIVNRENAPIKFFTSDTERFAITNNGVTFNGDTAAANALDDYEEGTWTMGVSFGGASVGVTYSDQQATYTKIGRQVTVNGYIALSNKGISTGNAFITGLPFTIANSGGNYSSASFWFVNLTYTGQLISNGPINTTTVSLQEVTEAGANSTITDADFTNTTGIIISFTYFV